MEMSVYGHIFVVFLISARVVPGYSVLVFVKEGALLGETVDFTENEYINVSTKIDVFRGIPYAEKPVRFQPPVPKKNWDGMYHATYFQSWCSQYTDPTTSPIPFEQSENCLYLNVYAPSETTEKVAVMVYIHGGGFTTGTSMNYEYYGVPLAAVGNVVVVTFNYRVGAHGFLDTGDDASSGNFGLLDQALALQWVQNNIEAFGGDSSKVTLFGGSAGAGSVHFHLISSNTRHLFHQAIMQSGASIAPWSYREDLEKIKVQQAFELGNLLSCNTIDTYELVECLSQVDAELLEKTVVTNGIRMGPTIDGVFLQESPIKLTERGDFKHCPLMIGFNRDEGTIFLLYGLPNVFYTDEAPVLNKTLFETLVKKSLVSNNGPNVPELLEDAALQYYVDWSQADYEDFDYFETFTPINGDEAFSCPCMTVARVHAMMTSEPIYLYYMTIAPSISMFGEYGNGPGWLGAGHAEEHQFVFGYPFIHEMRTIHGNLTDEEKEISVKFMRYWTNFVKTGDPSRMEPSSSPGIGEWEWPTFTVPELLYKELSFNMPIRRGLKADECEFWNNFKPELQRQLASIQQTELEWREELSGWQNDLEEWRMSFSDYRQDPYCDG